jgi:uncharacterized protein Yka (UPF0111/DUF47 family)
MLELASGAPGVKLEASPEFMGLEPIERATLLNAALQLCTAAINAVIDDNPDDAEDIMDRIGTMEIEANRMVTN